MYIRSVETQSCPADVKQARVAISRNLFKFASAHTIIGFFPPSSREAPINRAPACAPTILPVAVEPVKQM